MDSQHRATPAVARAHATVTAMKLFNLLFALSLAANAVLLLVRLQSRPQPATTVSPIVAAPAASRVQPSAPRVHTAVSAPAVAATTQVTVTTNATGFHWSQLPADDLRQRITRLRALGCPEETLQDIAVAELGRMNMVRQRALHPPKPFWQSEDERNWAEQRRLNHEFNRESRTLMTELFGADVVQKRTGAELYYRLNGDDLSFLPEDKRQAVSDLFEEHSHQESDRQQRNRGLWDAQSRAEDAAAEHALQTQLAQVLTPAELERWRLEHSQTASQLQSELEGMTLSEAEYKTLFAIHDRYGNSVFNYDGGDDEAAAKANAAAQAAQQQKQADIRAALGEDRAKEIERQKQSEFQELQRLANRNGLPADVAVKVYDFKTAAEASAEKIQDADNLTDAQREAALRRIRDEAEQATKAVLGEKAFKSYLRNTGSWINEISPPPPPKPPGQ